MVHIVWVIGAVIAAWGIIAVLNPDWMKKFVSVMCKGKMVYLAAGIKILIGIVFLILATQCKHKFIIIAFGILTAGGAAVFCAVPFSKITAYVNWWKSRPLWMYRLWGVAAVLLGALIIYAGWPN